IMDALAMAVHNTGVQPDREAIDATPKDSTPDIPAKEHAEPESPAQTEVLRERVFVQNSNISVSADVGSSAGSARPPGGLVAPGKRERKQRLYVVQAVGLILVVTALFFVTLWRSRTASRSPSLGLNVAWEGNSLRLTWNRKIRTIRPGTWGILSITDGGQQQTWKLHTAQLTKGSIVYWPTTNDVN